MRRPSQWQKIFTSLVTCIYLITNGGLLHAVNAPLSHRPSSIPDLLPKDRATFPFIQIQNNSKGPTLIFVRDIHHHQGAQRQIARIIQSLIEHNHLNAIGLEGAAGPLKFGEIQRLPSGQLKKEVAEDLLRENLISGPIYNAYTQPNARIEYFGLEDPKFYHQNVKAVQQAEAGKETYQIHLEKIRKQLNVLKPLVFNRGLLNFFNQMEPLHDQPEKFLKYLTVLSDNAPEKMTELMPLVTLYRLSQNGGNIKLEKSLTAWKKNPGVPLEKFPELHAYWLAKRDIANLRIEDVWERAHQIENEIYTDFILFQDERNLLDGFKRLRLESRLLNFELSNSDWRTLKSLLENPNLQWPHPPRPFLNFYKAAQERDKKMVEQILLRMKNYPDQPILIVAGGFHEDGIYSQLNEAVPGMSWITIQPQISNPTSSSSNYLKSFMAPRYSAKALDGWLATRPMVSNHEFRQRYFEKQKISIKDVGPKILGIGLLMAGGWEIYQWLNAFPVGLWAMASVGILAATLNTNPQDKNEVDWVRLNRFLRIQKYRSYYEYLRARYFFVQILRFPYFPLTWENYWDRVYDNILENPINPGVKNDVDFNRWSPMAKEMNVELFRLKKALTKFHKIFRTPLFSDLIVSPSEIQEFLLKDVDVLNLALSVIDHVNPELRDIIIRNARAKELSAGTRPKVAFELPSQLLDGSDFSNIAVDTQPARKSVDALKKEVSGYLRVLHENHRSILSRVLGLKGEPQSISAVAIDKGVSKAFISKMKVKSEARIRDYFADLWDPWDDIKTINQIHPGPDTTRNGDSTEPEPRKLSQKEMVALIQTLIPRRYHKYMRGYINEWKQTGKAPTWADTLSHFPMNQFNPILKLKEMISIGVFGNLEEGESVLQQLDRAFPDNGGIKNFRKGKRPPAGQVTHLVLGALVIIFSSTLMGFWMGSEVSNFIPLMIPSVMAILFVSLVARSISPKSISQKLAGLKGKFLYPAAGSDVTPFQNYLTKLPKVKEVVYGDLPGRYTPDFRRTANDAMATLAGRFEQNDFLFNPGEMGRHQVKLSQRSITLRTVEVNFVSERPLERSAIGGENFDFILIKRPGFYGSLTGPVWAPKFYSNMLFLLNKGGIMAIPPDPLVSPPFRTLEKIYDFLGLKNLGSDETGTQYFEKVRDVSREKIIYLITLDRELTEWILRLDRGSWGGWSRYQDEAFKEFWEKYRMIFPEELRRQLEREIWELAEKRNVFFRSSENLFFKTSEMPENNSADQLSSSFPIKLSRWAFYRKKLNKAQPTRGLNDSFRIIKRAA